MAVMKAYKREYINKLVSPARKEWALTLKNIGTIDQETILSEAADHSRLDVDTLRHALNALTDAAVLYLKVGHGVQFGNFGSLQPSINVKAVTKEEDCTASTMIGGVKINMKPTGTFAKAIADMKVQLVNSSSANTSEGGDEGSGDIVEPDEGSGGSSEPTKYTMTFTFNDGSTQTAQYAAGAAISYPSNTSGYQWPDSKPSVMPAQNTTVTEVAVSGGGEGDLYDI